MVQFIIKAFRFGRVFNVHICRYLNFENTCIENEIIIGDNALKFKLSKRYFKPQIHPRNENHTENRNRRKCKRSFDEENEDFETPKIFSIYKIGVGSFYQLSYKIQRIRSANEFTFLNYPLTIGVLQLFSLFNHSFRQALNEFKEVDRVECANITQEFNRRWGNHGPPEMGVGFIFHMKKT